MFGLNNLWIEIPLFFWGMLQVPAAIVIAVQCISSLEYYEDKRVLLFWPLLVSSLHEKLNMPGTIIATTFISVLFVPAVALYFIVGSAVGLIYLTCTGFVKLFKHQDT
jgi:hypothetical protein